MNPDTTRTLARIQSCDMSRALLADPFTGPASLARLELIRSYQVGAEVNWLLKEHGVWPVSAASRIAMVRQAIGAALVRAGERLAAAPSRGASPATAPVSGTLASAD